MLDRSLCSLSDVRRCPAKNLTVCENQAQMRLTSISEAAWYLLAALFRGTTFTKVSLVVDFMGVKFFKNNFHAKLGKTFRRGGL